MILTRAFVAAGLLLSATVTLVPSNADADTLGTLITGTVVDQAGSPAAGAVVSMYAWPENSVLAAEPTGAQDVLPEVASVVSNAQGIYTFVVDPTVLQQFADSGDDANVLIDAATQDGQYTNADLSIPVTLPALNDVTTSLEARLAGPVLTTLEEDTPKPATGDSPVTPSDNTHCITTAMKDEGEQATLVAGTWNLAGKNVTHHASYDAGTQSQVGVGVKSSGSSSWSIGSTTEIKSTATVGFGTSSPTEADYTSMTYEEYRIDCPSGETDQMKVKSWKGGATSTSPDASKAPTPAKSNCEFYKAGSSLSVANQKAATFKYGVNVAGIVDLSTQAGYVKSMVLSYHMASSGTGAYLCGTTGPSTNPGTLVAEPTSYK